MPLIHDFSAPMQPEGSTNGLFPTVVLIHGRAWDLRAMQIFERVLPAQVARLYLQAPFDDPEGGFCWWNMFSEQTPQEGLELLRSSLSWACSEYSIDPQRMLGYGFSQGAAMLSALIQIEPCLFSAVALLAGFVLEGYNSSGCVPSNSADVLMISGTRDERVSLTKARHGAAYLRQQGFAVEHLEEAVGHKVGIQGMRRLKDWTQEQVNVQF